MHSVYLQVDISTIDNAIFIVLIIVFLLIFSLLFFVVLYRKSHNLFIKEKELLKVQFDKVLLQSRMEVQEDTCTQFSFELHDNICQMLGSAKLLLALAERTMPQASEHLATASEIIGKAFIDVRSISHSLNKEWLLQFDFTTNLEDEIKRLNFAHETTITFSHTAHIKEAPDRQIVIYRIVQESIQNSLKHGDCKNIHINLSVANNLLTCTIQDDGKGLDDNIKSTGLGIISMKQRALLLGGTIKWVLLNTGCEVIFQMPANQS